eukprot:scaffold257837_cov33-Tisochrysis_lutea.AAC.2
MGATASTRPEARKGDNGSAYPSKWSRRCRQGRSPLLRIAHSGIMGDRAPFCGGRMGLVKRAARLKDVDAATRLQRAAGRRCIG